MEWMEKKIRLAIYCEQMIIVNYLVKELSKVPYFQVDLKTKKEEEIIFFLGKHDVDFVIVGLASPKLEAICKELGERYQAVNFLLLSNDCSQGEFDLKILQDGVYETNYNTDVHQIVEEINIIHYKKWLIDYSLLNN